MAPHAHPPVNRAAIGNLLNGLRARFLHKNVRSALPARQSRLAGEPIHQLEHLVEAFGPSEEGQHHVIQADLLIMRDISQRVLEGSLVGEGSVGQRARIAAGLLDHLLDGADFLRQRLGVTPEDMAVPSVGERRGAAQRGLAVTTGPDGWMRFLHRFWLATHVGEVHVTPVELRFRLRPQRLHRLKIFVGACAALMIWRIEEGELLLQPSDAGAENYPPAREDVESGDHIRGNYGMAVRDDEHARAEANRRGAGRNVAEDSQRFEKVVRRIEWELALRVIRVPGLELG